MLAEEWDIVLPWAMIAIALALFVAAVVLYRWLLRRTGERE